MVRTQNPHILQETTPRAMLCYATLSMQTLYRSITLLRLWDQSGPDILRTRVITNSNVGIVHTRRWTRAHARQLEVRTLDGVLPLRSGCWDVHIMRNVADFVGEVWHWSAHPVSHHHTERRRCTGSQEFSVKICAKSPEV